MRRFLVLAVVFAGFAGHAAAANLTDIAVSPSDTVWLDESFTIEAACNGGDKVYVTNVTQDRAGGENIFSAGPDDLLFTRVQNTSYELAGAAVKQFVDPPGFEPGIYTLFVACEGSETAVQSAAFTARTLSLSLEQGLSGETYYAGQQQKLVMKVLEQTGSSPRALGGNSGLESDDFTATIDGDTLSARAFYNTDQGWIMNIPIPSQTGTHTVTVTAEFDGAEDTVSRTIDVADAVDFEVEPRTEQGAAESFLTVDVTALYQGQGIPITENILDVTFAGNTVPVNVSRTGDGEAAVSVEIPDKSPGFYVLSTTLDTEQVSATQEHLIRIPMEISGGFHAPDGRSIPFSLRFDREDTPTVTVDGKGSYTGKLTPGTYTVTLNVPHTTFSSALTLTGARIDSWSDAIEYQRYTDTGLVQGMRLGGLYAFQTALDYDEAGLTMDYTTRAVENPERLDVYHCPGWNPENAICYAEWTRSPATFDRVAGTVTVEEAAQGAYAIAVQKPLDIRYSVEKEAYTPGAPIHVTGVVQDANGNAVNDVNVTLSIEETDVQAADTTGREGIFTFDVPAPAAAQQYTVQLVAENNPYAGAAESFSVTVERPKHLSITAPDTLRLSPNETRTLPVYLQNTGYAVINTITPAMDNVTHLQQVSMDSRPLQINESRRAELVFSVPHDTDPATYKADIAFTFGDGKTANTVMGVTIEQAATATALTPSGMLTGAASIIPLSKAASLSPGPLSVKTIVFLIVIFQAGVISYVVIRRRDTDTPRDTVSGAIGSIKQELGAGDGSAPPETGQQIPVTPQKSAQKTSGARRENVMRAMSHIKDELNR